MGITYDAPNKTITVTGYTEETPCTFEDVYQADQSGGWGVVTKQGERQFHLVCHLIIGVAATPSYLKSTEEQIIFDGSNYTFRVEEDGQFQIGELTNGRPHSGSCIIWQNQDNYISIQHEGILNLYASLWRHVQATPEYNYPRIDTKGGHDFRGVRIENLYIPVRTETDCDVRLEDYVVYGCGAGIEFLGLPASAYFENLEIYNCTMGLKIYQSGMDGATVTINGFKIRNCTQIMNARYADDFVFNLINPDVDSWAGFTYTGGAYGTTYRKYTFNLKVVGTDGVGIEGSTVTLYDKDNTEVFSVSTGDDGTIAEQTVSRGYYDQPNGDTLQDYSPHKLVISKSGYQTQTLPAITMEKIDWTIQFLTTGEFGLIVDSLPFSVEVTTPSLTVEVS